MNKVIETIKERSSTRGYTAEPLTQEELNILLHAGLQAPTAANRQEIHFTVLSGSHPILQELEEEKNRLRQITNPPHNFYYEAPTVVVISADSTYKWGTLGNLIIGCILDAMSGDKKAYFSDALKLPPSYDYKIAIAFGHKAVTKEPHTYDAEAQITIL